MRVRMGGYTISMVTYGIAAAPVYSRRDAETSPVVQVLLSNKSAARTRQSVQHYKLVKI